MEEELLRTMNKHSIGIRKRQSKGGNRSIQRRFDVSNGGGVTKDYKQSFYWFKKSAEQGHAKAQYNLGLCYVKARGVEQDYKKAFYWYKKSQSKATLQHKINWVWHMIWDMEKFRTINKQCIGIRKPQCKAVLKLNLT